LSVPKEGRKGSPVEKSTINGKPKMQRAVSQNRKIGLN